MTRNEARKALIEIVVAMRTGALSDEEHRRTAGNVLGEALVALLPLRKECSCVHDGSVHDEITGACHYTNVIHGPCPCAATPEPVRQAQRLSAALHAAALRRDGLLR